MRIIETGEHCIQTCGGAPLSPYVCVKITEGANAGKERWIHKAKLTPVPDGTEKPEADVNEKKKKGGKK